MSIELEAAVLSRLEAAIRSEERADSKIRRLTKTIRELEPEVAFDAVFLDPFSPGVDGALWEGEFLGEVARRMAPRSWRSTYSASFRVRVALGAAGLDVGVGEPFGDKREGTLARPPSCEDGDSELPRLPERVARRLGAEVRRQRDSKGGSGSTPGAGPRTGSSLK